MRSAFIFVASFLVSFLVGWLVVGPTVRHLLGM